MPSALALLCASLTAWASWKTATSSPVTGAGDVDVLENVLRANDGSTEPPTSFSSGHVSPTSFEGRSASSRVDFKVKLSGGPLGTPVYHGGNVFVSGGFGSRTYYSFHAETGTLKWAIDLSDDGPSTAACDEG